MATAGPKPKKRADETAPVTKTPSALPRRRRRWFWIFPCLALAVAWFAPMIVAKSPILNRALGPALAIDGSLTAQSASLGWFSPISLYDIQVCDPAGEVVLTAESIVGDTPLAMILANRASPGGFTITHPVAHVVLREDGSNVEDTFATFIAKQEGAPDATVQIELTEGVIAVDDVAAKQQYQLENLALKFSSVAAEKTSLEVDASGTMPTEGKPASFKCVLHAQREPNAKGSLPATGDADCQVESFPLAMLQSFARRKLPGAQLQGMLSTQAHATWGGGDSAQETAIKGEAVVRDFSLGADVLGADQLRLSEIRWPCDIVQVGDSLKFNQVGLQCDLGQISLDGSAKLQDFSAQDLVASLAHEPLEVRGQLDLAKLAHVLPATLRIRQGAQISGGMLQLNAASKTDAGTMRWTGRLEADNLSASSEGQIVTWVQPMVIDFAAHETAGGSVLDKATCSSSFLQLEASGNLDHLVADAKFDLKQLMDEVQRFSDLDGLAVNGQGQAHLDWQRGADGRFITQNKFEARNFQLVATGRHPWVEQQLTVKLDASGALDGSRLSQLEQASLKLDGDGEKLTAELTQPLSDPQVAAWPIHVTWQGKLAVWLPRLESWVNLQGWNISGAGQLDALLTYETDVLNVRQSKLIVQPLHLWGPGLYMDEPAVEVVAVGRLDRSAARVEIPRGTITAGPSVVQLTDVSYTRPKDAAPVATGTIAYQADLRQVEGWLQDPRLPVTRAVAGQIVGNGEISDTAGVSSGRLEATIDQLVIAQFSPQAPGGNGVQPQATWREPKLTLAARARYDRAADVLDLTQAQIVSEALSAEIVGKVAAVRTRREMDLSGKVSYDWEQLAPVWRPYVGDAVAISGRETRPFAVKGPWPSDARTLGEALMPLTAQVTVGWSAINVHGFVLDKAEVNAQLTGGELRVSPLEVALSEGKLRLAPMIRLSPEPAQMWLPQGPLLTQVRLTPEICARGLQFVAPVLSQSTVAEGLLSVDMSGGRLPLVDPASGDVAGKLVIHSAQVRPGPLADQFFSLGRQIETVFKRADSPFDDQAGAIVKIQNQTVDFRMVDRRVYHQNMQFMLGHMPITTRGSVGIDDESLSMIAEIPLEPAWMGNLPLLSALKQQTIQVPIGGTLKKPKLDLRSVQQLAGQFIQGAARGALLQGLEKLLPSEQ